MPKHLTHPILLWSAQNNKYILQTPNNPPQEIVSGNEESWLTWLNTHASFSFQGQYGHIRVLKEARSRGAGYWYAYYTREGRAHKRYLGRSVLVTVTRLEDVTKTLTGSSSLPPPFPAEILPDQRNELLSTKLSPPHLPGSLVDRSRLLVELDAARWHPLTLVSAPAGTGKTTLLSTWVASLRQVGNGKQVATWLSLDALDAEAIRFWISIIAALRVSLSTIGEEALMFLRLPLSPPISTVLTSLLNELAQVHTEIFLILEDYHVIEEQEIHESLLFFIEHLPANMHLILATRTDPELPLSRWRVRGQLNEIRNQDLRFTETETADFLVNSMLPLTKEDIVSLSKRTEGWIAGLQLAVLSLRKQTNFSAWISEFAGSSRFVLDYIKQDILERLPVPLQHFLLQMSIVTRMNATLCQAVMGDATREACQQMLEEVERANLFIVPLDEQRQWYRFHDLFREALLVCLHSIHPQLVSALHTRAARFYEETGEWQEAITHALAASNFPLVASLTKQASPHFWLRGQVRTVHSWILALPDAELRANLPLALAAALRFVDSVNLNNATLHASMATEVERTFTRMEMLVRSPHPWNLSETEKTMVEHNLQRLRAWIELRTIARRGDIQRLRLLSQSIEAIPPNSDASWNIIPLSISFWLHAPYEGFVSPLIPQLQNVKQEVSKTGDTPVLIRVMSWLALAYTKSSQLQIASQECLEALSLLERTGRPTALAGYLYYTLFLICYNRNDLEEASAWLEHMLKSAQEWQQVEILAMGEIYTIWLALAQGNHAHAKVALHQLEALVEQEGFAHHTLWLETLRVQCWLAEDRIEEASQQAAMWQFTPENWNPLYRWQVLMLVRLLLKKQQYTEAAETLSRFSAHFDHPGSLDAAPEWMALSVIALHHTGQFEQAADIASRLLHLTRPEGHIRMYLDTNEPIMTQVLKVLLETQYDAMPGLLPKPMLSQWLSTFLEQDSETSPLVHQETRQPIDERLSPQEIKVLRLLVAGHTYAEMATILIVSVHTIKTQVSSIYRKLDVNRRAEAIAIAHQQKLI